MKEHEIERYLIHKARERGGFAYKLVLFNCMGFPDRTILLPKGRIGFLELKSKGKKPSDLQRSWLFKLQKLGFSASWVDSKKGVDSFLDELSRPPLIPPSQRGKALNGIPPHKALYELQTL